MFFVPDYVWKKRKCNFILTLRVVNMNPSCPSCRLESVRSSIRLTSEPRFLILHVHKQKVLYMGRQTKCFN